MEKLITDVICAVFFENKHILVMRRAPFMSYAGSWEFPGGKLEKGESHVQCLARELREELGIETQIGEFLVENNHEYDGGIVHLCVYRVLSWSGEMALTVHDDMRWVSLHELVGFPGLLSADIPIARKLEKILN